MFIKEYLSFIEVSKRKTLVLFFFIIGETFFAISSIAMLYPLLYFLQHGNEAFQLYITTNNILNNIFMYIDPSLVSLLFLSILPIIIQALFRYIKSTNIVELQVSSTRFAREKTINAIFTTSKDFFIEYKMGDIANALSIEMARTGLLLNYYLNAIANIIISLVYIILMLYLSLPLTFIAVLFLLPIPYITKKLSQYMRETGQLNTKTYTKIQIFLLQRMNNFIKVKMMGMEKKEIDGYENIALVSDYLLTKVGKINAILNSIVEPLMVVNILIIIYFALDIFVIEFSEVLLFIFVLYKLTSPIKSIFSNFNQVNIYRASFDKVKSICENASKYHLSETGTQNFEILNNTLVLESMTYGFTENIDLFNELNVSFESNVTTAIIGKSGSGKSTLIDLLLRFRMPKSGKLMFGNVALKDLKLNSLYKNIGYVTQNIYLFDGTIKENLLYGLGNKTEEEMKLACRRAHILDFITSQEDQFNTQIGESGGKLSGGQKQRLQLAHLFLQDPDIIIMDEPTSALDSESEKVIVNTLKELHGKKTIIIIAHRLSTIQHADKIIVLEDGKVIEEGSHQELLKNDSRYRKYFDNNDTLIGVGKKNDRTV